MSVAIQVSPELKHRLQQKAEQAGLNIERYLKKLIDENPNQSSTEKPITIEQETILLKKINTGFTVDFWKKYGILVDKRKAGTLTNPDHEELLRLSNEIESANAMRIQYLIQLAQIRKMDLDELMSKLGISPTSHA